MHTMNNKHTMWTAVLLSAAVLTAQQTPVEPGLAQQFARARLLEQQEGDLPAAERAYRAILGGGATGAVADQTALALGTLLWRLGRVDDAAPFLEQAIAAGGELGSRAKALRDGEDDAAKHQRAQYDKARQLCDRIVSLAYARRSAKEADHAIYDETRDTVIKDLLSLGEVGSQVIVANFDEVSGRGDLEKFYRNPDLLVFRDVLWLMDTAAARSYLVRVAEQEPVDWQRFLTASVTQCPPGLAQAVLRLLQVDDPAGIVQSQLRSVLGHLPANSLIDQIDIKHPAARSMLLYSLANRWLDLDSAEQQRIVAAEALWLPTTPVKNDPALALLQTFGAYGPRNAALLTWRKLAEMQPADWDGIFSPSGLQRQLGDTEVILLHTAMHRLTSADAAIRRRAEHQLGNIVAQAIHDWSPASIDNLLDCIDLGVCAGASERQHSWLSRLVEEANENHRVRLHGLLHRFSASSPLIEVSRRLTPDPALCAPLRHSFAALTKERTILWEDNSPVSWKHERPGNGSWPQHLEKLLGLMVHHADAELVDWLIALLGSDSEWATLVAQHLAELSERFDSSVLREALRTLLIWEAPPGTNFNPSIRARIFGELARLGDVAAIPLYPRAYELGLQKTSRISRGSQTSEAGRGIEWLGATSRRTAQQFMHGYQDGDLSTAWRLLLEGPSRLEVWTDIENSSSHFQIPTAVLSVVLPHLPALAATWPKSNEAMQTRQAWSNRLRSVLDTLRRLPIDQWQVDAELQATVRKLLTTAEPDLAVILCENLPRQVIADCVSESLQLLDRHKDSGPLVSALMRAGITPPLAVWQRLRAANQDQWLQMCLVLLQQPLSGELQALVEEVARSHAGTDVRAAAGKALARTIGAAAVPTLLQQLRDPADNVKKTAQAALDELRTLQEQQRFWQAAQAGVDTAPASTAAKLLLQAAPNQPKERRLLAIRAMGTLGEPAALPYLIDWSADPDSELAAAARQAFEAVQAAGKNR